MKILLASSEVHPFSKTGGLADMVGALGKYLARRGDQVAVITPLYGRVPRAGLTKTPWEMDASLGLNRVAARIFQKKTEDGVNFFFLDQPGFYDRPGLYQEAGADYPDNAQRFIFFSKCIALFAREHWPAEVVHLHDWQTALAALYIADEYQRTGWTRRPRTCFTIHNLAFQGVFPAGLYPLTNLGSDYLQAEGIEFYGQFNCLKAGLLYSDLLTTVSPNYAREITTRELGCGLEGLLRMRQDRLIGILNGVDYGEWTTGNNPFLKHSYSLENMAGKAGEKRDLQLEMGLPARADVPLFGSVSRLADQKGFDILLSALEELAVADLQFVFLGTGATAYQDALLRLRERFPEKVGVRIGFDIGLSHRIEAGADFYLMPSRFEPCGLNQMYSLRYGTIPIVRATGGLDDTVIDATEDPDHANGIKFHEYSSRALVRAIRKAEVLAQHPEAMARFRENAMEVDFSWERTAGEYHELYRSLIGKTTPNGHS